MHVIITFNKLLEWVLKVPILRIKLNSPTSYLHVSILSQIVG